MRFSPYPTHYEPELNSRDWADKEARMLAADAEAFARAYATITHEQADDLRRAVNAIHAVLDNFTLRDTMQ